MITLKDKKHLKTCHHCKTCKHPSHKKGKLVEVFGQYQATSNRRKITSTTILNPDSWGKLT